MKSAASSTGCVLVDKCPGDAEVAGRHEGRRGKKIKVSPHPDRSLFGENLVQCLNTISYLKSVRSSLFFPRKY